MATNGHSMPSGSVVGQAAGSVGGHVLGGPLPVLLILLLLVLAAGDQALELAKEPWAWAALVGGLVVWRRLF